MLVTGTASNMLIGGRKEPISFSKGLVIFAGSGLAVSNSVGKASDEATDEVKKYIKKVEEDWNK